MSPKYEEKITFISNHGVFCHRVMSFGLKNARAIYQWLVNRIFKDQIDQNLEVYMDDMLFKSRSTSNHISDLKETFNTLHQY